MVLVREAVCTSLVVEQAEADGLGLSYDYVATMISLRVHSALDAVGRTAAVAAVLAEAGMSCNVVAGWPVRPGRAAGASGGPGSDRSRRQS